MFLLEKTYSRKFYGAEDIPLNRILVIELDDMPLSLDPSFCLDYNGSLVCQALWEPLLLRDEATGKYDAGVCKTFQISPNKLTYHFHLHTEKRWSDGMPVVAEDFVTSFQRMFSLKSPVAQTFLDIWKSEEVWNGELDVNSLGVRALDTFLLEICLDHPISHVLELFGSLGAVPFPTHLLNKDIPVPVSNGPYVLKKINNLSLEVLIHPYAQTSENQITQIRFDIHTDISKSIERYRENIVHITCHTHFPYSEISSMSKYADFHSYESPILFNLQLNPNNCSSLSDSNFKKLLSAGIDRHELATSLKFGVTPSVGFIPKSIRNKKSDSYFLPHPSKFNFKHIDNLIPTKELTIIYADFYPNTEIAQFISDSWKKNLNLTVMLEKLDFPEFVSRVNKEEYDICLALISSLFAHPVAYYLSYLHDMVGLEEEEYYSYVLEKAIEENDDSLYLHLEQILFKAMPVIPLCSGKSLYLKKPTIKGYQLFADGRLSFRNLQWV